VTARDGLNDRLSFDGLRVIGRRGNWRYGGWITRPVLTEPNVFDDSSDATQTFSGA
jgi:Alginate export